MYNETKNPDGTYTWDKDKIKKHYNELLDLLSQRENILIMNQSQIASDLSSPAVDS